ncbi:hypothetical protein [Streptomyces liangshanensis]|uniref:Uncharacterized protein n=1 Tax=Streptomyces liangshanensis TaxID=2717324 RepID=A0A6G9GU06_9ACTN|nr:hypothetical protein [Streptomyces liangshanensis]QIQ01501.1 hypothetical protein HA039_03595 [Streptomyces liangshanensis]
MRRRLVGAVAAGAALAGMATAVAPAAGAAERGAGASASVWRNIVIDGTYTIRDDEGLSAGTYCNGNVATESWVNEERTPYLWWSTTCGGEIRTEMHVSAQTDAGGGARVFVTLMLFEGTTDTNDDRDAFVEFDRYIPADKLTRPGEIALLSVENGGKDWAKFNLTLRNTA